MKKKIYWFLKVHVDLPNNQYEMKPKKKSNSVNNLVDKLIHPKRELMIWEVTLQKLPKIQHREIKQGRKYERLRHVR